MLAKWGIALITPHLVVLWHYRLEASAEFQAWRKLHDDDEHKSMSSAKHVVLLIVTVAAVVGAGWLLMVGGGSTVVLEGTVMKGMRPLDAEESMYGEQQPTWEDMLTDVVDMPSTTCTPSEPLAPPTPPLRPYAPHPTAWHDAAWQALLLMVVVVGISTAWSLLTRMLRRGQHPITGAADTCATPGGAVMVEVPVHQGSGKPEPLYGQVLILQAELAKKARELQTACARCMELDAVVDVLRDENRELQQQATRSLEAKVWVWGLVLERTLTIGCVCTL